MAGTNIFDSIALQLEHLAFVKAITFHHNHYVVVARKELERSRQAATAAAGNAATSQYPSLIVIMRLKPEILSIVYNKYSRMNTRSLKRKHDQLHQQPNDGITYPERPLVNYDQDETEGETSAMSTSEGSSLSLPFTEIRKRTTGNKA